MPTKSAARDIHLSRYGMTPVVWSEMRAKDRISDPEFRVLIALSFYWCGKDLCYPTLKQIEDVTGIRKDNVKVYLKSLDKKNIIGIEDEISAELPEGVTTGYRLLLF